MDLLANGAAQGLVGGCGGKGSFCHTDITYLWPVEKPTKHPQNPPGHVGKACKEISNTGKTRTLQAGCGVEESIPIIGEPWPSRNGSPYRNL